MTGWSTCKAGQILQIITDLKKQYEVAQKTNVTLESLKKNISCLFFSLSFSHLLSRHVHVPDDDASVRTARDELTSVRRVEQALHFVTATDHKHTIESLTNKQRAGFINTIYYYFTFTFFFFLD